MRIPTSYNRITLRQLIEVHKILSKGLKDYDENIAIAAYFTSKTPEQIEALDYDQSVKLVNQVRKLKASKPNESIKKIIWIKGIPYKAITDIEKFSKKRFERFVRLTDVHQRAALLYKPLFSSSKLTSQGNYKNKEHHEWESLAEKLLDQKVNDIYGAVFFLRKSVEKIMSGYRSLFNIGKPDNKPPHEQLGPGSEWKHFTSFYGWYWSTNMITQNDPFKEDLLDEWNVRSFFFRLQFENDKARTENKEAQLIANANRRP
jgi:hypothetical protein